MRPSAAFSAAILVAGCGILPGHVPEWVANRQPLESCGEETPEGLNADARACILDAYETGSGAELISTQNSVEGDPITRYIRVHENGVVEIFHDATRDSFGSGEWERLLCAGLIPVADVNDPPDDVYPAEMMFIEDACEPLPVP
ncbi:MAG TPA: hypothetical protein VF364_12895 [Candidatus Limnocylindria bacterium]